MSPSTISLWRSRMGLFFGAVLLLGVTAGCTADGPVSTDPAGVSATLGEFITSFARNAAAAWLL